MKQQNITILLLILMSMVGAKALAYDIAVENEDGVTIYYNYINDGKELEVAMEYGAYNGLKNLKIPAEVTFMNRVRKVTSIEKWAFHPHTRYNNSISHNITLNSIYIPKTINHIGQAAFWDCQSLKKVYIEDIGAWCEIDFELDGGTNGGGGLLSNPLFYAKQLYSYDNSEITDLVIPEGTSKISYGAFRNCLSFTSVKIANSVKTVEEDAFQGAENINRVDIGNGVNSIGDRAFYGCKNLNTISFGNGIRSIGIYAFHGSNSLDKIIVNDIEVWCGIDFEDEQYGTPFLRQTYYGPEKYLHLYSDDTHIITDLIIPESVSTIKAWAFNGVAGIRSIIIPDNVVSIGRGAFSYCPDLENVRIGDGVTEIVWQMFEGCSKLSDVKFGKNVTSIGSNAFSYCGFTSLNLPEGIKEIKSASFKNCSNLTSLTIPSTVKDIGSSAFDGADMYTIISLIEDPLPLGTIYNGTNYPFTKNTFNNATLYVPEGTIEKYKTTDGWKNFVWIEEGYPTGIKSISTKNATEISRYNLNGQHLDAPSRGINIIKMSNGEAKKLMVK